LAASNQFCGINAIIFYAKQLFMRITNNNNNLSQLIIIFLGIIQIIATFIGGRMMDKWSKRNFLFAG
jgi:predicted MFS family arabinose efflux permease